MRDWTCYYKHDDLDIVVRDHNGCWYTFSSFNPEKGWYFTPDMAGILCGEENDYHPISEEDALAIVEKNMKAVS